MMSAGITRVLLVDDHPMVLVGVRTLLSTQENIQVVGEAASAAEVYDKIGGLLPDIVILDISLPDESGIDVARRLHELYPDIKIIIHSMHDEQEYIEQFIRCGGVGYVLKQGTPEEIISAVQTVINRGAYFSPKIAQIILRFRQDESWMNTTPRLTQREEQVLKFVAKGKTNKEIGDILCISARTAAKHRESLMHKLDMHSIAELTQYAISKKLI